VFLAAIFMIFAYLDEFGHIGPFHSRNHPRHNTSPVFGLAGFLLPEHDVRPFASFFLKRKSELLAVDIEKSGKQPFEWEKKGSNLFTANSIGRYPEIRQTAARMLNRIKKNEGRIFYYGREKYRGREDMNANGLYKTVLAHTLRQIDEHCSSIGQNFVVVVDEHSARKELLEAAAKTMFGSEGAKRLISTPFEVESYLNQNIQAADWIAALVGRLWNYKLEPGEFGNYELYHKCFWTRLHETAVGGGVMERPKKRMQIGGIGHALLEAQKLTELQK